MRSNCDRNTLVSVATDDGDAHGAQSERPRCDGPEPRQYSKSRENMVGSSKNFILVLLTTLVPGYLYAWLFPNTILFDRKVGQGVGGVGTGAIPSSPCI